MKLIGPNAPPGEWAFQALFRYKRAGDQDRHAWDLTEDYYVTQAEVNAQYPVGGKWDVKWPVGVGIYIYAASELGT